MPYIPRSKRDAIYDRKVVVRRPGELNYFITRALIDYWRWSEKDYHSINDILGALEGAKLEFYRRVAVPYEDAKIQESGDVY